MEFYKKISILKNIIFAIFIFGAILNASAQNSVKDNFFADTKTIDLMVSLDGDFNFCNLRESDIKSAAGYVLANSPLRRIDKNSLDTLYVGLIVLKAETERGGFLGCTAAINFEFWRFSDFKGRRNIVTVWSKSFLTTGTANSISGQVNSVVERTAKEFIAKWAEQN